MEGLESILNEGQPEIEQTQVEQVQQTMGEETAAPAVEQEDEAEKHRKGLEATVLAERRRRQELERELAALKQPPQNQQTQPTQKPQPDGVARPKRDSFANQEEYEDALLEYGDKRREAREQQARQEREQQDQEAEFWKSVDAMIGRGTEKYQDFTPVVNAGLGKHLGQTQQGQALRFALSQSDRGEDVAYYLGKNTAEADRVAALPPAKMLLAIGVIEDKLSADNAQDDKPVIPQTLTQQRNAQGRFQPAYSGPTPLSDVLAGKT